MKGDTDLIKQPILQKQSLTLVEDLLGRTEADNDVVCVSMAFQRPT